MVRIAQALNRPESRVQLILLCGKNEEVISQLRAMDRRIPMWIEGFTREVPFYMELSDFFIGKPGPGSISEALVKRLPVVVQRNAWTMAHERYNADWIEEQQVGLVVRSFFLEISAAVETLAVPSTTHASVNARLPCAILLSMKFRTCWRKFCRSLTETVRIQPIWPWRARRRANAETQ